MPSSERLRGRLIAIRNLSPNAPFIEPRGALGLQLFGDLLELPNDVDALDWFQRERPGEIVALALVRLVEIAEQMNGRGWEPTASNEAREALTVLDMVRDVSVLPRDAFPTHAQRDPIPRALLRDVLSLCDSADTLAWLERNHLPLCARIALDTLTTGLIPTRRLYESVSSMPKEPRRRPYSDIYSSGSLKVWIDSLWTIEDGFVLQMRARFRRPKVLRSMEPGSVIRWEGPDSVTDEEGYHYVGFPIVETSNRLWRIYERLTLVCWPAPRGAGRLRLKSQPACLSVYRPASSYHALVPLPKVAVGDFEGFVG